ncbi:MAG: hypothetical protein JWP00_2020 [Chloroflexi bacterium]|jgi:hypothetical protein|nr:hypothetical protein [Chloroflexota bacterium]
MKETEKNKPNQVNLVEDNRSNDLRQSPMMAHLQDALEKGTDIGHYGRLTFAMIARHFLKEDELIRLLGNQPDHNEDEARALVSQVKARNYNPPRRERLLEWQSQQDFPICPNSDDTGSCNVYAELKFPNGIYENIQEFYEKQTGDSEA